MFKLSKNLLPRSDFAYSPTRVFIKFGAMQLVGLLPLLTSLGIYLWCAYDFAVKGHGTPAPYDPPEKLVISRPLSLYTKSDVRLAEAAVQRRAEKRRQRNRLLRAQRQLVTENAKLLLKVKGRTGH